MDIPPVNIGPERIISSCDGVAIKEKDFKYRVRQTSIYVHGVEYYNATEADRYIAHQKYKRCLDMVAYCDLKMSYWAIREIHEGDTGKFDLYSKWHERWMKLADYFKSKASYG